MVFTLHRYIFRELLRVFILAGTALTIMLSLTMMLRPIQEYGVAPEQAVHLFGYFIPITLTFVLPMAAIFAAALIYGRFASDNELDACRASGISMWTLIYPGLILAIAISMASLVLSFHVVPAFVQRAEKSMKDNAKNLLFRNIERKGYCELPDSSYKLYADNAVPQKDLLQGVVVAETTQTGINRLVTAGSAKILIDDSRDRITVVATDYYQIDDFGQEAYTGRLPISSPFPSLMEDDIKFQKVERLKQIRSDMMKFSPVRELALQARGYLAIQLLAEQANAVMNGPTADQFQLENASSIIYFTADKLNPRSDYKVDIEGPIHAYEIDKATRSLVCIYESPAGMLQLRDESLDATMDMLLENPTWDRGEGLTGIADSEAFRDLVLPDSITQKLSRNNLLQQIPQVTTSLESEPTQALKGILYHLDKEIWSTRKAILSEIHSRLVLGIGCIVIVLISIALGIKFRGGHILSAFGASAIPAGALVIFIMSGKELTKTKNEAMPEQTGILVMWAGLVILMIFAFRLYRKLLKT
ncbi:lipopolysaccharide ABC transporter permease [Anaerohalosphaera lusitana]|uniref:Lipopolysaccharide ABC transporter permease n=1 Tax=Anaerohalosphaera lusitana TaxID=1936003 RepID=A0A1U9NH16_9BACT|nr:LptF/LptG family permease [Anaerohalosphaera lusitana]AQT67048.1 lipopolysaccharide ABC transporter permease [Anaerohalosphaera lusitana]